MNSKLLNFLAIIAIAGGILWYYNYRENKKKQERIELAQLEFQQKLMAVEAERKRIEQARRDSIQREEERVERITFASNAIDAFAKKYLEIVTPNTGQELSWKIDEYNSTYNYATKTVVLVFDISWKGKTGLITIFEDEPSWLTYRGRLTVFENYNKEFEAISKNEALVRAENNSELGDEITKATMEKLIESILEGNEKEKDDE